MITVEYPGTVDYRTMWHRQQALRDALIAAKPQPDAEEHLILLQHNPVYTLGRHAKRENILVRPDGVEFIDIERGGDITYHGPGQMVGYFIIDLDRHGIGVKRFVEVMEQSVIATLADYGISAGIDEDAPGVWLPDPMRKICALGLQCRRGVTMHGLALNVSTDLTAFTAINPCGFTDRGVTSMAAESGVAPAMDEVMRRYAGHFLEMI